MQNPASSSALSLPPRHAQPAPTAAASQDAPAGGPPRCQTRAATMAGEAPHRPALATPLFSRLAGAIGLAAVIGFGHTPAHAAPPAGASWDSHLSRSEMGADQWQKSYPDADGRGVVIAILDTGVDPTVPGLLRGPQGETKVIEARDFSGDGRVSLEKARHEGDRLFTDTTEVRGLSSLSVRPLAAQSYWIGSLDEASLRQGPISDLNGNGRSDDRFAVVSFRREGDGAEVVIVDTDGDGSLEGEQIHLAYASDLKPLRFKTQGAKGPTDGPVTLTVTPLLDDKEVEFHFDGGGHGTHCAGIAAGYAISGEDGFDGIAPGAEVMSLKIGRGTLAGGATTPGSMASAIQYASDWAETHQRPVVMNISYGVGSGIEGSGEIQRVLDEALRHNRWLSASVSAGNEGPGLSSVGNPAGTTFGWTAGAMIPKGAHEALYGGRAPKDTQIFWFSSRGGELNKPDGLSPGVAWSTVPDYLNRAIMNGTSMAAPQASGAIALLISGALQQQRHWSPALINRALRDGAKHLKNYHALDQGAGLIHLPSAWRALNKLQAPAHTHLVGWKLETPTPARPGLTSPASYWRVGGYIPQKIQFRVTPTFYADVDANTQQRHLDTLTLKSDVPWLDARRQLSLRGPNTAPVELSVQHKRIPQRTGTHTGRIRAYTSGVHAFDLIVSLVIGEDFRDENRQTFKGKIQGGENTQYFIETPPAANDLRVTLDYDDDDPRLLLAVHSPEGHRVAIGRQWHAHGADLPPGTWELSVIAPAGNRAPTPYTLQVDFGALEHPDTVRATESDAGLHLELPLRNLGAAPFIGEIEAEIRSLRRQKEHTFTASQNRLSFTIPATSRGMAFGLELSEADWARMTDFALNIINAQGETIYQDALGQRETEFEVTAPPGTYQLELVAGFTDAQDDRPWALTLQESRLLRAPIRLPPLPGTFSGALYPHILTPIRYELPQNPAEGDFTPVLHHQLTEKDGTPWAEFSLPIQLP